MKLVLRVSGLYYSLENTMTSAGTKTSMSCTDIIHNWQYPCPEIRYTILCHTIHILIINISANKYVFIIKRLHSATIKKLNL